MASTENMASTMDWLYGEIIRAIIFVVKSNGGQASFDKVASEFSSSAEYPEYLTYNPRDFLEYIVNERSSLFEIFSVVYTDGIFHVY